MKKVPSLNLSPTIMCIFFTTIILPLFVKITYAYDTPVPIGPEFLEINEGDGVEESDNDDEPGDPPLSGDYSRDNGVQYEMAMNSLTAQNYRVHGSAQIEFWAPKVILKPGFQAKPDTGNGYFRAGIPVFDVNCLNMVNPEPLEEYNYKESRKYRVKNESVNVDEGNFAEWATLSGVQVLTGDFNGDGRTDVALLRQEPGWETMPVAYTQEDGTYEVMNNTVNVAGDNFAHWATMSGVHVITGNFNEDNRTDVALLRLEPGWDTMPVAYTQEDGTYEVKNNTVNVAGGNFAHWATLSGVKVLAGDFNGDDLTDIALLRQEPGWDTMPVAYARSNGFFDVKNESLNVVGGNFAHWATLPGVQLLTGDFNGDGRTDVALLHQEPGWNNMPVAYTQRHGNFVVKNESVNVAGGNFAHWATLSGVKVLTGDFNADGRTDVALLRQEEGWNTMPVAYPKADHTFEVKNESLNVAGGNFAHWATMSGVRVITGNFDADGRTDVALLRQEAGWDTMPVAYTQADGSYEIKNQLLNQASGDFAAMATMPGVQIFTGDFDKNRLTDVALLHQEVGWNTLPVAYAKAIFTADLPDEVGTYRNFFHDDGANPAKFNEFCENELEILNYHFENKAGNKLIKFKLKTATEWKWDLRTAASTAAFYEKMLYYCLNVGDASGTDLSSATCSTADLFNTSSLSDSEALTMIYFRYPGDASNSSSGGGNSEGTPFVNINYKRTDTALQVPDTDRKGVQEHEMGHAFWVHHTWDERVQSNTDDSNIMNYGNMTTGSSQHHNHDISTGDKEHLSGYDSNGDFCVDGRRGNRGQGFWFEPFDGESSGVCHRYVNSKIDYNPNVLDEDGKPQDRDPRSVKKEWSQVEIIYYSAKHYKETWAP